ncbi:MAG: hypothetical protein EPN84_12785 [Legionella sp.]|nr:MAG: hypothetical protein EPN84_12785 [Legionella sp.]
MKKTVLHVALFSLALPLSAFALGLGDMKIQSALDQPFKAEIELVDVGDSPLSGVRVNLADLANFERVGIERSPIVSLLFFSIDKNEEGKPVIKVFSQERMTEPFMEIVVDVAWPDGQLFKAYTILLDPPGYHLTANQIAPKGIHVKKHHRKQYSNEPGVIDKTIISTVDHTTTAEPIEGRGKSTYGPTILNENIWQIAQRYKSADVILPQVVLAIVGANPGAFTDGNLNGLKVGVRLNIPASAQIQEVPIGSVNEEVAAHDTAWNEKTAIQHVIAPPYIGAKAVVEPEPALISEIPAAPKFTSGASSTSQLILNGNLVTPLNNKGQIDPNKKMQIEDQDAKTKAEIAITTAAIESVRESNSLLMDQLKLLQDQNKKLQDQLAKRDNEMEAIRNQMQVLMKERLAIASQASTKPPTEEAPNFLLFFILLALVSGGTAFAFMYFRRRELAKSESPYLTSSVPLKEPVESEEDKTENKESTDTNGDNTPMLSAKPLLEAKPVVEETKPVVEEVKPVVEEVKPVVEEVKPVVEEVKPVVEEVKPVIEEVKPVVEEVKPVVEEVKPVVEEVKPMVEEVKPVVEEAKPVVEEVKPVVEEAKPVVEEAKPEDAKPKTVMDNFTSIVEKLKSGAEIPEKNDAQKSEVDVDKLKSTVENINFTEPTEIEPQIFIEETKNLTEEPKDSSPVIAEEVDFFKAQVPIEDNSITEDPVIPVESDIEFEKVDQAKEHIQIQKKPEPADDSENHIQFEATTKEEIQTKPVQPAPSDEVDQDDDSFIEFDTDFTSDTTEKANIFDESNRSPEQDEELLEFETGLHEGIEEKPKVKIKDDEEEDNGIEFTTYSLDVDEDEDDFLKDFKDDDLPEVDLDNTSAESTESAPTSPLKSEKALDTLLALAKTYLGMDDFESARHSLEEVQQYGNTTQKEEATRLLAEIKDK